MKKIPLRRCVATMTQVPKKELLRIVRTPEGEVKIDITGKANGRGAYLLKTLEAVDLAQKKGALNRALECQIPSEVYDDIRKLIQDAK
jgi:predicted RNA-binding protein YlxR (DUF448 family)